MNALFCLTTTLLNLVWWVLIIYIIMGWLINFSVINLHNQVVSMIYNAVSAISEPIFAPIRKVLPVMGGLDFAPLVPLILISIINVLLIHDIAPALGVTVRCG